MKKRISSIITALALCVCLLPTTAMAAGNEYTVASQKEFEAALLNASSGDTIRVSGSVTLNEQGDDALVIDKNVTITGGKLIVRYSGIVLGADVIFDNIALQFANRSRNAIMANGYTLTMNNVLQDNSGQQIHLFCGGVTGYSQENLPAEGGHGEIIISGNTVVSNIYAGSISSDGKANTFDERATITLEDTFNGTVGSIYASGAMETPVEGDRFDAGSKVAPPTPSVTAPYDYITTGDVTIQIYENMALYVDGATGGERNATVVYNGRRYPVENVLLTNIAGLSVNSGYLVPKEGSSFSGTDAEVFIDKESTLGLKGFGRTPVIGDFTGDGSLVLAEDQTLTITGEVSGATNVYIGYVISETGSSGGEVEEGHAYIQAANYDEDNFILMPTSDGEEMELVYDENYGTWTACRTGEGGVLVENFNMVDAYIPSNTYSSVDIPLNPTFAAGEYMYSIPLWIMVGGDEAEYNEEDGSYICAEKKLEIMVTEGNKLNIVAYDGFSERYDIVVMVPKQYSASGEEQYDTAWLYVSEPDSEGNIEIQAPNLISGLTYTGREQIGVPEGVGYYFTESNKGTDAGQHNSTAELYPGYIWEGNYKGVKTFLWNIGKADGLAAPTGLSAVAPSVSGGDGKIVGTTEGMEYAKESAPNVWTDCEAGETTGLAAGTYYVRVINTDSDNYEDSKAATVDIPEAVTISSIKVNSTAHKTVYTLGEDLDVSGLSILVTMSDGSTRNVVVTKDMVSGFSSDQTGELTLTVAYKGVTTTYTVSVGMPVILYTVTFEPNGGAGTTHTVSDISGVYTLPSFAECGFIAPSGQRFQAWAAGSANGQQYAAGSSYTVNANTTFYAVFENVSGGGSSGGGSSSSHYGLTFETNGGSEVHKVTEEYGNTVDLLNYVPTREGYEFTGWYSDKELTNRITELDMTGNITVYAGWKEIVNDEPDTDNTDTTMPEAGKPFTDVKKTDWFYDAVASMRERGLMSGTDETTFSPNAETTRGMIAAILYRVSGESYADEQTIFLDVNAGQYYNKAVAWGADNGIISGYDDGLFRPEKPITREELAVLIYRYAQYKGIEVSNIEGMAVYEFTDWEDISDWSMTAVRYCFNAGIISGRDDGSFDPQGKATRAEAASMIMRFMKNM